MESEMMATVGSDSNIALGSELELNHLSQRSRDSNTQSISSETYKGFNDAMAHSQSQDFNRAKFSKADGASLKREYEDFFAVQEVKEETKAEV